MRVEQKQFERYKKMKNVYEMNGYEYKKLYSCNAMVNKLGLISYHTVIVEIDEQNGKVIMNLYHSNTTMSHVRKYIGYLRECGKSDLADKVNACYRECIASHISRVEWHNGVGVVVCE